MKGHDSTQDLGKVVHMGILLGLTMAACVQERTYVNENHCASQGGDAWCQERYAAERPYCVLGTCGPTPGRDGCVTEMPEDLQCASPCGDSMSALEDGSCLPEQTSTGATSSSTGDPSTGSSDSSDTGLTPCVGHEDCPDAAAPFCDPVGQCVTCQDLADPDGACSLEDPLLPVCDGGQCVQCTPAAPSACMGTTPICDVATNTCQACTAHGECAPAACNLFTGACLPPETVLSVGPGEMYATIGEALASIGADTEGTLVLREADYNEAALIDGKRIVALLAADGELPRWVLNAGGSPQLIVQQATVLLDGLQLSSNASTMDPALVADGGQVWIDRSRIVNNTGGSVLAQGGAELVVRNTFAASSVDTTVIDMQGSTATLLYSTLGASFGQSAGLRCDGGSTVTLRNSLVVSRDAMPEVDCPVLDASYSAAEMMLAGDGNTALGDMDTGWFQNFNAGDLHLATAPVVIATTGQWQTGDPPIDIDGDPRPNIDGVIDVVGADVP